MGTEGQEPLKKSACKPVTFKLNKDEYFELKSVKKKKPLNNSFVFQSWTRCLYGTAEAGLPHITGASALVRPKVNKTNALRYNSLNTDKPQLTNIIFLWFINDVHSL